MNFKLLPCLGLLFAGLGAQAQIVNSPQVQRDFSKAGSNEYANLTELTRGAPHLLTRSTTAIGSPYADARWLTANVTLANKQPLEPMLLKYDVIGHRLLMRKPQPSPDSIELDDHQVASFVLQDAGRPRLFRRFTEAPTDAQRLDYVEVLHEGSYMLLKKYQKTIKREAFQGMYANGIPTDEIEDASVYYLRTPEGILTPVKLSLKPLQTAAPALSTALKTAASAQKPRTESDWAAVLNTADPAK
jgi:hypothetical protein